MDKLVYIVVMGLCVYMVVQVVIVNNMVNVLIIGFCVDCVVFDWIDMKGGGIQLEVCVLMLEEVIDVDCVFGVIQIMGCLLDVVIIGIIVWFVVQVLDGLEVYICCGDLEVVFLGVLQIGDGFLVIGLGGLIILLFYDLVLIVVDGLILIVLQGGDVKNLQIIDKLKFVDIKGLDMVKGFDNLLCVCGGGVLFDDFDVKVQGGVIEGLNVNMMQVLVDMIENQCSYEVQVNMLKFVKDMDESGVLLMCLLF